MAPNTTITSAPEGEQPESAAATFTWTGTDDRTRVGRLTFAYRLSPIEPGFSTFSSVTTVTYRGLSRGRYTLLVVARDSAGNQDPTPAQRVLTVGDFIPPETAIAGGPAGTFPTTRARFTWTGSDARTATANLAYASRLDPIETAFSAFGPTTSRTYENLPSGAYTFYVKARDEAGNEDPEPATRRFAVAMADDPLISAQWHLSTRTATEVVGTNAQAAWTQSSGISVVVGVVDDGLQHQHPDLDPNYVSSMSWDFNDNDPDPTPAGNDSHGTAVAGLVAARGSNTRGVSGMAPFAGLAGLRLISAPVGDVQEAEALAFDLQGISVISNSWGPADNGSTLSAPGFLAQAAIENAIQQGRGGLGRIFVWAAGNGRHPWGDSCSFDGYATQRFAMAVGALASDGTQAFYSESCPGLFLSAPSGGHETLNQREGLTTTDLLGTAGSSVDDYRSDFSGTSAAAPVVSGVVALMLDRTPALTWRDVQYILAQTAVRVNPGAAGWTAGRYAHNEMYGFGLVDARAAVDRAARWPSVPPEQLAADGTRHLGIEIPDNAETGVSDSITIPTGPQTFIVEHVEVEFDATHPYRGDLELTLTSPAGVVSTLAPTRVFDSGQDFSSWMFRSVRHWGERADGNWTLKVADRFQDLAGTWNRWTLRIHGRQAGHVTIRDVSPRVGTGANQVFAFQYGDTAGGVDVQTAWVWFNATFASSAANSCLAYYDPVSDAVFLLNDASTSWVSARLGTGGVLENSQCAISMAGSSAAPAASGLMLTLAMRFKAPFGGAKNVYMFANSQDGASTGWVPQGTWNVPGAIVTADSVAPFDGSGVSETFTLRYSDTLGASDLSTAWVWFNETFASTAARSCLVHYDRRTNALSLVSDAANVWLVATLGAAVTLENSQCAIALGSSTAQSGETDLTLTLAITFKAPFSGLKNIYMYAASVGGVTSEWQLRGTWNVPPFPVALVAAHSVTPNSGSGVTQSFVMQYSDTLGAADLSTVWVWFNETFASTAAGSCVVYFEQPTGLLRLIDDAGTFWLSAPLGGGGMLENSQCRISLDGSSVATSGTTLTLTLTTTFKPAFSGAKSVFMFAASAGGNSSGWLTRGTWTVP